MNIEELSSSGLQRPDNDGIFWHWAGYYGIRFADGKFTACDMFDNGELRFAPGVFADLKSAIIYAESYFT